MTNQFPHPNDTKIPAFQAGVIRSLEGERVTVVLQGLMGDDSSADDVDLRTSIYEGSQGIFLPSTTTVNHTLRLRGLSLFLDDPGVLPLPLPLLDTLGQ